MLSRLILKVLKDLKCPEPREGEILTPDLLTASESHHISELFKFSRVRPPSVAMNSCSPDLTTHLKHLNLVNQCEQWKPLSLVSSPTWIFWLLTGDQEAAFKK